MKVIERTKKILGHVEKVVLLIGAERVNILRSSFAYIKAERGGPCTSQRVEPDAPCKLPISADPDPAETV